MTLTEQEINAFLARHLRAVGGMPYESASVRLLPDGGVSVKARVPLRAVAGGARVLAYLPTGWLHFPVWVRLDGRIDLDVGRRERRYVRLRVERFALGRQVLPWTPGALRGLRWRVPDQVESVTIGEGRAVFRLSS